MRKRKYYGKVFQQQFAAFMGSKNMGEDNSARRLLLGELLFDDKKAGDHWGANDEYLMSSRKQLERDISFSVRKFFK